MSINLASILEFIAQTIGATLTFLLLAALAWAAEKIGRRFKGSVEKRDAKSDQTTIEARPPPVNIQLRDRLKVLLDLGPLAPVLMHNGRGRTYKAKAGIFSECDPEIFTPGTVAHLSYGGTLTEELEVRADVTKQTLFVRSKYSRKEIMRILEEGLKA